MKYVKVRAENYKDAMIKLKQEHGEDAIPISHNYVKEGGLFKSKFFARDVVELTAAVQDKKPRSGAAVPSRRLDVTVDDRTPVKSPVTARVQEIIERATQPQAAAEPDGFGRVLNRAMSTAVQTPLPTRAVEVEERPDFGMTEPDGGREASGNGNRIERELDEIKRTLSAISNVNAQKAVRGHDSEEECYIRPLREILQQNDYDADQCDSIIGEVKNSVSRDDLKDRYKIEKSLKDLLKSRIVTTGPIRSGARKKIIMFIGPTGVGKTTTMAKLGAICSLREGKSVSFITVDNYRIAATEQLKKYAEIMNIPIHAVNNQKEFRDVVAEERAEIIMVDTSGRSHRNDLKISEIKSFADIAVYECEKMLCVSANTKKSDLADVFRAFDVLKFDSVIITKVDETSFIGNVVDIADKYNKPISYYSNGQEVPNDIVVADPERIVDMILGSTQG